MVLTKIILFFIGLIILFFIIIRKQRIIIRVYISMTCSFIVALLFFLDVVYNLLCNAFPHTLVSNGDGIGLFGLTGAIFIGSFDGFPLIIKLLWYISIILAVHVILLLSFHVTMQLNESKTDESRQSC